MKYILTTLLLAITLFTDLFAQITLTNGKDSLSYAIGMDIAGSFKKNDIDLNKAVFIEGLKAAFDEGNTLIDKSQIMNIIREEMAKIAEEKLKETKRANAAYLAENKQNPNVKETPEGVQYEIITHGNGEEKALGDSEVIVHYKGTLLDGTEFDSSYKRQEPLKINLQRVIKGWQIGIPLMTVGSKYRFYVPPVLGYGDRANGVIPANSVLIFEIELIEIVKKDEI